jgi:hypothetical protein
MNKLGFYLTTIINDTNVIDKYSNYCLTPLHGLLRLVGKTVKVYEVDLASEHATEITSDSKLKKTQTLWKVVSVFLQALVFIIATPIGIGLKGIAQLGNITNKKNQTLFQSLQFYQSVNESSEIVKTNSYDYNCHLLRNLHEDITLNYIFYHLSPNEIIKLRSVNKLWWNAVTKISSGATHYLSSLKGLSKTKEKFKDYSYCSLMLDCNAYAEKYSYSPELIDLFDGIHNLLRIPLLLINEGKPCENLHSTIDDFAHSPHFYDRPSIIRLRIAINTGSQEDPVRIKEIIVIKYTLFIPKECGQEVLLPEDTIWHDYLFLEKGIGWKICDPRYPSESELYSRENKYPMFPYTNDSGYPYPALFSDLVFSQQILKKLLKNNPIGLFRSFSNVYLESRRTSPRFILKKDTPTTDSHSSRRTFRDLPVMLGHRCVEEMTSLLKIEWRPNHYINETGKIMHSCEPINVMTF